MYAKVRLSPERDYAARGEDKTKDQTPVLYSAVVVKNYLEIGSKWAVLIPCDTRKDATGTAQFLNSMIREAESKNGATHVPDPKEEKLIVLPPAPEAAEP